MIKNTFFVFAILILTLCGCAGEDNEAASDSSTQAETNAQKSDSEASNPNTAENLPWTFLVTGRFHNNITVSAGSGSKGNVNEGHWIDFKENGTYDYGVWGDKEYDGKWFYDGDTYILDLSPNDDHKKSQWKVMHKDDNLIWMGTPKFGDNAIQVQWLRREGYPSKQD